MPVINITMAKTSEEQKAQLISRLTEDAVAITKIDAQYFTVLIHELDLENLGVGGKTVKSIYASR